MGIARLFRRASTEPGVITVEHGDARYAVTVRRRPDARRFTLRVSNATGEVTLTMPQRGDAAAAARFARSQSEWIATRMLRIPERIGFTPGGLVPVRGEAHRIIWSLEARALARLAVGPDGERRILVGGDPDLAPRKVEALLRRLAAHDLDLAVQGFCAALGVEARSVSLRDPRTRWGSCSSRGRLNFSWRLIMAPPHVLQYLAAHEVCHLREMNHSDRFWTLVYRLFPETDAAEAWLKAHGAGLHRYGKAESGADEG